MNVAEMIAIMSCLLLVAVSHKKSNVSEIRALFRNCINLQEIKGIENWESTNVSDLYLWREAFFNVPKIQVFNLENMDFTEPFSRPEIVQYMFYSPTIEDKVPTIIISPDDMIEKYFNEVITGREYGGPTYNANGGSFDDGKAIKKYFNTFVVKDKSELYVTEKTVAERYLPQKNNATFGGWYLDEELTIKFDFSRPIDSDLKLYASWHYKDTNDPVNPLKPIEPENPDIPSAPTVQDNSVNQNEVGATNDDNTPNTGDASNMLGYLGLLATSFGGMTLSILHRKGKNKKIIS